MMETRAMQKDSRLFDDLARVAGGAMSSFGALRDEAEARLRDQLERILDRMDLVRRDEFDAVREMAIKAREENARTAARLDKLEGKTKPAAKRKTAAKRGKAGKS
jgi:hypothetical protein